MPKAWFRSAPVGQFVVSRCASPLSVSTTSSVYPFSSRSCSPASRPSTRQSSRPGTRPSTRPSSPASAETTPTSYRANGTKDDRYLAPSIKTQPHDEDYDVYSDGSDYSDDSEEPSPVTPTVRAFVGRERSRLQHSLLSLRETWTVHSEGQTRRQGNRRTVTHEYVELALDVIDRWDEALGILVEALAQAEDEWYFAQDLAPEYDFDSGMAEFFQGCHGHGDRTVRGIKRRIRGHKEMAAAAMDAYLELRFETAEQLDELEATWRSMMRLV